MGKPDTATTTSTLQFLSDKEQHTTLITFADTYIEGSATPEDLRDQMLAAVTTTESTTAAQAPGRPPSTHCSRRTM
ncbi:hypothetical protein [Streptomyces avermitilis]|uniref:hypothetical protein n=1 Tax=Streptomyces avermitilis TaxID=33903 RepID=UPI00380208DD